MADPRYTVRRLGGPLAAADLDALRSMRLSWAAERRGYTGVDAGFEARLRAWWERQSGGREDWLATGSSGAPVGMVNAAVFERMPLPGTPDPRWAYVGNLWVEPAHRRRGIARALMGAVLDWARAGSMERIVLNPSAMSVPLYTSLGFRPANDLLRLDL